MDESGGESHRERLSLSWFPAKRHEFLRRGAGVKKITNGWPGPICYRRIGHCWKCFYQRFAPCSRRYARRCEHLVPSPQHPSLYHRRCASFSTAPQMPSVLPLVSIGPISLGCPRCPCFPSTSSNTVLSEMSVKNGRSITLTHSIVHVSLPLSRSQGSLAPRPQSR